MLKAFLVFAFLQVADLGTTVAVFRLGGVEENPLVKHLMFLGPVEGVILAKIIALAIGGGCFLASKYRALLLADIAFGVIVAWNLSIIARLV
ncbi:MAG: DUF5658 family protein [Bryobacteraceae bacterium]